MRIYVYVDGESHFTRHTALCNSYFGPGAKLSQMQGTDGSVKLRAIDGCSFFWVYHGPDNKPHQFAFRCVYFTSASCDEDKLYEYNMRIRKYGFEPHIVLEKKQLRRQRENVFVQEGIIEKAKGVDIALATRILEDAFLNNFDSCVLYTSDVDFLPVIQAVRRMGKSVHVVACDNGLSPNSKLRYVPDSFEAVTDEFYRKNCELIPQGT